MSWDHNIYLPSADPPVAEIRRAIDVLGLPHGESADATDWWIDAGTTVHITLRSIASHYRADSYRGWVQVSSNGLGRAPQAWSVQFAVAYVLLAYLPGAFLEDAQTLSSFTEADDCLARVRYHFGDLPEVSRRGMVAAGLLDA